MARPSSAYEPRDPTSSALHRIVLDHFETFRAHAASRPRTVDCELSTVNDATEKGTAARLTRLLARGNTYLYYTGSSMPMTVRLSARMERAVDALAHSRRQTRSDVVRDALEHYAATNGGDAGPGRPYDAWQDVIGVVGRSALRRASRGRERTTGEQFTALIREKARARRPR